MEEQLTQFDRLPPHNLDAEHSAVGSMLLCGTDLATFDATRRLLRSEYFYLADLGIYFDAVCRIRRDGKPIDARIVKADLERSHLFEETGGMSFLAKIIDSVPSAAHGPHYAAIVREMYVLREIIRVSNTALRRVYAASNHDRSAQIAQELVQELSSLAYTGIADKIHTLEEAICEVFERMEEGKVPRIPTGIPGLDGMVGGLPKGKFTQVGGRPSMGKSLLCKQIVLNIAKSGVPCGIVTVEEDRLKIAQNYLSNASGIENNKIIYSTLGAEEWEQVYGAVPRLPGKAIHIADAPVRLSEVEGAISAMVAQHRCEVVVVDYLQLIDPESTGGENENREITKISKSLKAAFKRTNVAGLVACQLNRANETGGVRKPTLKDLRGSGSLEQDGDLIILLHREDYYRKSEQGFTPTRQLEAIVAKNKDGDTGTVPLYFSGATQTILDWAQRPAESMYE